MAVSKANHLQSQYKALAGKGKVCVCACEMLLVGEGVGVFALLFVFDREACGHKCDAVRALTLTRTLSLYTQDFSLWSTGRNKREMRRSTSLDDLTDNTNGNEDLKNDKNEEDTVRAGCPVSTITAVTTCPVHLTYYFVFGSAVCAPVSNCMQLDDTSRQMGESLYVRIMVGDVSGALTELKRIEQLGEQQARRYRDYYCSHPTECGALRVSGVPVSLPA